MKMSFLITAPWIHPIADGAGCKLMATYSNDISTTKTCRSRKYSCRAFFPQYQLDHREQPMEQIIDLINVDDWLLIDF